MKHATRVSERGRRILETSNCPYCGATYGRDARNRLTCGREDCLRAHRRAYKAAWAAQHPQQQRGGGVKVKVIRELHGAAESLAKACAPLAHSGTKSNISAASVNGGEQLAQVTAAVVEIKKLLRKVRVNAKTGT